MNKHTTIVNTQDGRKIKVTLWHSPQAKAYLHICHGMAEHIDRYKLFSEHMAQEGYNVICHNHRGHGDNEALGHYANKNGWIKTIDDIKEVQDAVIKDSTLPLFLFGHSMGSFIVQGFSIRYGNRLSGLVLSGTNYQHPLLYHAGRIVAKFENLRLGLGKPSQAMDKLSFASFNTHFKPNRTPFDWLSSDSKEVDKYIKDPLCGFPCSSETWKQLLTGLIEISDKEKIKRIPTELPIYIFGGDKDPVGRMGKGIPALVNILHQTGHKNVTYTLYKDGRHEMLNESCKVQVYKDTTTWLDGCIC